MVQPRPNTDPVQCIDRCELTEWEEEHQSESHADSMSPEDPPSVLSAPAESVVARLEHVVVRPVRERVRLMVEEDLGLVEDREGSGRSVVVRVTVRGRERLQDD